MASDEGAQIVEKARQVGAAAAGIASLQRLRDSPSHEILARFGTKIDGEYSFEQINHFTEIDWPADARSALVISVSHPRDKPELDWSCASGNTLGTQLLAGVSGALTEWLEETLGVKARRMPYWVEEGGVYVKDAAVLAGLGCIGRNNLLVSPECGPRLRLRVMLLDTELAPTGPAEFNPCRDCDERCRVACPREAFEKVVLSSAEVGVDALPGTTDPSAGRDASCRWVRTRRTPAWRSTTGSCRRSICHGRRQRESSMQRGASSGAGAVNLPVLLETDPPQ
jgi:epoxyqueuosine reductase